jgi:glutathione-regulated potassium-efflux system ancillary protein KefG
MSKVLILFAHPLLEKSRVQSELLKAAHSVHGVTVNDLYQSYPDFDIDIDREQQYLLDHNIIIWQHPFYWYSAPAILKQWQDIVLEHGWAYGKHGNALTGKKVFNVLSSGGPFEAYQYGGYNKYTIHDFLRPFERTAELCKMNYYPPFWVHGTHRLDEFAIKQYADQYQNVLKALVNDIFSEEEIVSSTLLNDLFPINLTEI